MSRLAHGLAADLVPPDWPKLTHAELAPVLASYPALGPLQGVAWHSQRPFAASAILHCANGPVFAKRHHPQVRTLADLACEHAFIAHLRHHGASVPAVLATATGATAVSGPSGTYELHALAQGTDTYRDAHSWTPARSPTDAAAIGQALACLHLAAEGFTAPPRRTPLLVAADTLLRAPDLPAFLDHRLAADPMLRAALLGRPWQHDLAHALLGWHQALAPHLDALAPLWTHNDAHASNLFWQNGRVSAVLDFGLCNRTSATFDLATAIERNTIAWLTLSPGHTDIAHAPLAHALLQGYDTIRPRPPAERLALRHVLPLVHVDFALSELAYFHAITRSPANAEAAYTDFLLGHAAWFAGENARCFLESLTD